MSEPFLKIHNNHTPGCGDPPTIDTADENYVGYFQNRYGEQWIYTFNPDSGTAILRGGDVGWNEQYDVTDGTIGGLILSEAELLWLGACVKASQPDVRSVS